MKRKTGKSEAKIPKLSKEAKEKSKLTTHSTTHSDSNEASVLKTTKDQAEKFAVDKYQIIESISDGFLLIDSDLTVVYFNNAAEKYLGRKRQDIIGNHIFKAFPEAKGSIFEKKFGKVLKEQKPLGFETHFKIEPYVNWYDVRVFPNNGGISVYFKIITDMKRAEEIINEKSEEISAQNEALQFQYNELQAQNKEIVLNLKQLTALNRKFQQEKRLAQHYLDIAGVMFIAINKSGIVTLANAKAASVLGYPETEIMGKNWFDHFLPKENVDFLKNTFKKVLSGEIKSVEYVESYVLTNQGEKRMIAWHNSQLLGEDGTVTGTLSSGEDITDKKLAEVALKESEARFRSYITNAPDGLFIANAEGRLVEVNPSACKITGYSEAELLKRSIADILADETKVEVMEHFMNIKNKGLASAEFRFSKKNGEQRIWSVDGVKISDHQLMAFVKDVTNRKVAEEKLKENKQRFDLAMRATEDGLYDWDLVNDEIYYSPGWKKMLGYEDHELENKFSIWEELTNPEDVKTSWDKLSAHIEGKIDRFELEFQMKHRDGHWVDILSRAEAIFDENGKATRVVGTHVDISERKKIINELQKQNEFINTLLDNIPIGIATNNFNEGYAIYMNKKFEEIYGWPKKELESVSEFFNKVYPDKKYREKIVAQTLDDINSGDPSRMHWENVQITTKAGEKKWINAVNIPLFEQNIMVSTVMDITKLKKVEEELRMHKGNLEELIKERTHELKKKNDELEKFNKLFVGREFRIKELREKIKKLEEQMENH